MYSLWCWVWHEPHVYMYNESAQTENTVFLNLLSEQVRGEGRLLINKDICWGKILMMKTDYFDNSRSIAFTLRIQLAYPLNKSENHWIIINTLGNFLIVFKNKSLIVYIYYCYQTLLIKPSLFS